MRARAEPPPRPGKAPKKLAIVTTAYYYLSHAYHVGGRFLHGYLRDGKMHYPDFGLAGNCHQMKHGIRRTAQGQHERVGILQRFARNNVTWLDALLD